MGSCCAYYRDNRSADTPVMLKKYREIGIYVDIPALISHRSPKSNRKSNSTIEVQSEVFLRPSVAKPKTEECKKPPIPKKGLLSLVKQSSSPSPCPSLSLSPEPPIERKTSDKTLNLPVSKLPIRRTNSNVLSIDHSCDSSQVSTLRPSHHIQKTNPVKFTSTIDKKKLPGHTSQLNQYKVLHFLGKGASGKVYKVEDRLGRVYALKVYNKRLLKHKWLGKNRTGLQGVRNEICIMETLEHPHVIELLEVIENDNSAKIYMVLEYAEKGTLHDQCPMSEERAKKYMQELTWGLHYLHESAHVIHRDLKPQNLLIDSQDRLRISDFGEAHSVSEHSDMLVSSAGTFTFMAPELMGAKRKFHGKPLDVWALGITLYYMLIGCSPYKSHNLAELSREIKDLQIHIPTGFSDNLRDFFGVIFEKIPEKRITIAQLRQHPWLLN